MFVGKHHELTNLIHNESHSFTRPLVVRNCFNEQFFSFEDVQQIINNIQCEQMLEKSVRLYLGRGLAHPTVLSRYLRPLRSSESVEQWSSRLFGTNPFGLIINNCQLFHDSLARRIATLGEGIFTLTGFPAGGLQAALFIGNYGYTPFGVHRDKDERFIIHAHLGPGKKTMILWDSEDFQKMTGSSASFFDPDLISNSGIHSEFGSGDMYVLPAHFYHIGHTNGFSVGLAIAFVDLTARQLISRSLEKIKNEYNFSKAPEIDWYRHEPTSTTNFAELLSSLRNDLTSKEVHYKLSDAILDYQMLLRSNHGFREPPKETCSPTYIPDRVRLISPFKILWRATPNTLLIYARQRHFDIKRSDLADVQFEKTIFDCLRQLNSGLSLGTEHVARIPLLNELLRALIQWQTLESDDGHV